MKSIVTVCLFAVVAAGCATTLPNAKEPLPNAKEPCAGVANYKDDFGKSIHGLLIYMDGNYRASGLNSDEGRMILRALFAIDGLADVVIPEGTWGKVALTDGTVLDLATVKPSAPVGGANPASVFTQWAVDFGVSKEQAEKLSSSPLKAIKLEFGANQLLVRLNDKNGDAMQHLARCLAPDIAEKAPESPSPSANANTL